MARITREYRHLAVVAKDVSCLEEIDDRLDCTPLRCRQTVRHDLRKRLYCTPSPALTLNGTLTVREPCQASNSTVSVRAAVFTLNPNCAASFM